jgi:2-oxoacid:acceptor oxidoreductase gamma subunit (pyruvate/2-ketoisovalerate family)
MSVQYAYKFVHLFCFEEKMALAGDSDSSEKVQLPDGVSMPLEIRVHGRGGQGGVTCAKLIAALFAQMGLSVQTFGDYGSERSGAPVQAFTRVDRVVVSNRNKVYRPDHLLVLDPGLLETPVLSGVSPGAFILLNAAVSPAAFGEKYHIYRFAVVNATDIAREQGIGSSSVVIVNTTIVGAYARLLGLPLSLLEEVFESLGLHGDLAAAEQAYEQVQIQEAVTAIPGQPDTVPPVADAGDIAPIAGQALDIPVTLKTGLWSNQTPVYRQFTAPCNAACPAGNDIVGFIQTLKNDGPEAAAAVLLRTQALPSVCGRVCPAPCMTDCNRNAYDGAVNIRSLERWIADHAQVSLPIEPDAVLRKFAVVGGGPAGLSAAYHLALRGHDVTLYEGSHALGGVLLNGIPAFRLPLDVLSRDIGRILAHGVKATYSTRLDKNDLVRLAGEHDAVIICTGFGDAHDLGVVGDDLAGVEQGLPFLERVKQSGERISGRVVVVGGGNSAIDCARSALRCGASSVKLVYRRGREEMPAIAEEIIEAEREGVRLMTHRQPVSFIGTDRISGIMLAEVEPGPPAENGRSRPIITSRTALIPCDSVLLALGQQNGIKLLPFEWQVRGERAWLGSNPLNVWLAGDCSTGEGTVTHAIGNGRRVALSVLAALDGTQVGENASLTQQVVAPAQIRFSHFEYDPPRKDRHLPLAVGRESFKEFNLGLAGPEEADRCFSCGHCTHCDTCLVYCPDGVICRSDDGYRIDQDHCKGCGMCVAECPRSAMEMIDKILQGVKR